MRRRVMRRVMRRRVMVMEGETDCHKDCDKGSYTVIKYD